MSESKFQFVMPDGNVVEYEWNSDSDWHFEFQKSVVINRIPVRLKGWFKTWSRNPENNLELYRIDNGNRLKTPKSYDRAVEYTQPFHLHLESREDLQTTLVQQALARALRRVELHFHETLALRQTLVELGEASDGIQLSIEQEQKFADSLGKIYYFKSPTVGTIHEAVKIASLL